MRLSMMAITLASTGRNIIKARTACRAFAEATWKR